MEKVQLVLVDFDDTLVETAPRFARARGALFRLLAEDGFDPAEVARVHHEEVDPGMRARHGFGPARLGPAFVETYRALCAATGGAVDPAVERRCLDLAAAVAGTPPAIDGALPALRALAARVPTAIYTQAGNLEYQLGCLRDAGALDIVGEARVRVVPVKTAEALRQTLDAFDLADTASAWMVGNSIRSDVNPALELGVNAILVEQKDPWHHDVVVPLHDAFHRVATFRHAVDFLLNGR
ncbi:MAG TPA: HAD family hydrolase [Longimicrobiales bacterium]|nr:HAD family hydrolase [Longimicrobiales bacterium]